jgi:hypothetical protein
MSFKFFVKKKTVYSIFSKEQKDLMTHNKEKLILSILSKKVAANWGILSSQDKIPYIDQASSENYEIFTKIRKTKVALMIHGFVIDFHEEITEIEESSTLLPDLTNQHGINPSHFSIFLFSYKSRRYFHFHIWEIKKKTFLLLSLI